MRRFAGSVIGLSVLGLLVVSARADAAVSIIIDKNSQQMSVAVDGVPRYRWPVSSGLPAHETPNGSFKAFRMEVDHYSKEWDDAPMPHSIFFTRQGHAIHGTDSVRRLGNPASHGCVRLSRENAATLFELVQREGVLNTTVTLSGSSQVALARNPKPKTETAAARANPARIYDTDGRPLSLTPSQSDTAQQIAPRADDNYIYPADEGANSSYDTTARNRNVYPAPRAFLRLEEAQAGDAQGYYRGYRSEPQVYAPEGYVYAPRPYYYGPRGY